MPTHPDVTWIDVLPSLRHFGRELNAQLGDAMTRHGRQAGDQFGRAFNSGAVDAVAVASDRVAAAQRSAEASANRLATAQQRLEQASARVADAQRREADAAGQVRVAQERLNAVRDSGNASTARLAAAEEGLARAQRNADAASQGVERAQRAQTAAASGAERAQRSYTAATENQATAERRLAEATAQSERAHRGNAAAASESAAAGRDLANANQDVSSSADRGSSALDRMRQAAHYSRRDFADLGGSIRAVGTAMGSIGGASLVGFSSLGVQALAGQFAALAVGVGTAVGALGLLPGALTAAVGGGATLAVGMQGVVDTFKAASAAANPAASAVRAVSNAQETAARQVQAAERALTAAQRDAQTAQENLTRAREEAAERQEDLALALRGGQLAMRDAVLDVADAERELQAVLADPNSSTEQRERATIALERARLRVDELSESNADLVAEEQEFARTGVEGSREVVAAKDRLRDAEDRVTQANDALKTAMAAVTEAAARQTPEADKLAQAMANLSPNAREFVNASVGLKDAWNDMRMDVQDRLFRDMGATITELARVQLPMLREGLGGIADGLNYTARGMAETFNRPDLVADMALVLDQAGQSTFALGRASQNLYEAWLDVSVVGATMLHDLSHGFEDATARFAAFIDESRRSGELEAFIQLGIDRTAQLGRIFGDLGSIINSVFWGGQGAGTGLINSIEEATNRWAEFLNTAEGEASIVQFFTDAQRAADAITPVLASLGRLIFDVIIPAFSDLAVGVGPVLVRLFDELGRVLGTYIVPLVPQVADAFTALVDAFIPILEPLGQLVANVLPPFLDFLIWIAPAIPPVTAAVLALWGGLRLLVGAAAIIRGMGAAWGLLAIVFGSSPLGAFILLVGAFAAALVTAYQTSEDFRRIVDNAFATVGDVARRVWADSLQPALAQMGDAWQDFADDVGLSLPTLESAETILGNVATAIADGVVWALQRLEPYIPVVADGFGRFLDFLAPLLPPLQDLGERLLPIVGDLFERIAPIVPVVADAFMRVFDALAPVIPIVAGLVAETVLPVLVTLIETLAPLVPQVAAAFVQVVDALAPLLPELAELLVSEMLPLFVELIESLAPLVPVLAETFVELVEAVLPFVPPIAELASGILQVVVEALGAMLDVAGPLVAPLVLLGGAIWGIHAAAVVASGVVAALSGSIGLLAAHPYLLVAAGITALAGALVLLEQDADGAAIKVDSFRDAWDRLNANDEWYQALLDALHGTGDALSDVADNFMRWGQGGGPVDTYTTGMDTAAGATEYGSARMAEAWGTAAAEAAEAETIAQAALLGIDLTSTATADSVARGSARMNEAWAGSVGGITGAAVGIVAQLLTVQGEQDRTAVSAEGGSARMREAWAQSTTSVAQSVGPIIGNLLGIVAENNNVATSAEAGSARMIEAWAAATTPVAETVGGIIGNIFGISTESNNAAAATEAASARMIEAWGLSFTQITANVGGIIGNLFGLRGEMDTTAANVEANSSASGASYERFGGTFALVSTGTIAPNALTVRGEMDSTRVNVEANSAASGVAWQGWGTTLSTVVQSTIAPFLQSFRGDMDTTRVNVETNSAAKGVAWTGWGTTLSGVVQNTLAPFLLSFRGDMDTTRANVETNTAAKNVAWTGTGQTFQSVVQNTLAPFLLSFRSDMDTTRGNVETNTAQVGSVWSGMATGIRTVYDNTIVPVWNAISSALASTVDGFSKAAGGIAVAWDRVREAAAAPVRFVINPVFAGLRNAFNTIVNSVGLGNLAIADMPVNFAVGGPVPGWSPHDRADNIPALLTAREYVQPVHTVDYYGTEGMDAIRAHRVPREVIDAYSKGGHVTSDKARVEPGDFVVGEAMADRTRNFLAALNAGQAEAVQAAGGPHARGPVQRFDLGGAVEFARAQNGKPYIWGGVGPAGYDCSGFMSAITRVARGQTPHVRLGNTATFPWPGFGATASAFKVGAFTGNPGHMAGTISGNNVEAGGSPSRTKFVTQAAGADSGQFTRRAYLTEVGGVFTPGAAGVAGAVVPIINPLLAALRSVTGLALTTADSVRGILASGIARAGDITGTWGNNALTQTLARMPTYLVDQLWGRIKPTIDGLFASEVAAPAGATGTTPAVAGSLKAQVAGVFQELWGWGTGPQWAATDQIVQKESSWVPTAQNPTSTASGLFQHINSTWAAYRPAAAAGYTRMRDAPVNMQAHAGGAYIRARYGTPTAALAFHNANNWYGLGGLVSGLPAFHTGGMVNLANSRPWDVHRDGPRAEKEGLAWVRDHERVLTPEDDGYMKRLVRAVEWSERGGRGERGGNHTWHIHANNRDQGRELADKMWHKLRTHQRGGRYPQAAVPVSVPTFTAD